jgi:putative membrane protein
MTYKHLILAGAALAALTACDNRRDDVADANVAADTANLDAGEPNAAAPAGTETASGFANKVAASDQFEIESGKLAAANAASADVKAFGTMLVTEHQKSSADLKAAAGPDLAPAPTLDPDQTAKLAALKGAQGAAFDKLFLEQQVAAHRKAHDLLTAYSGSGDNQSLKGFAAKAAPVVKHHLDRAEALAGATR